jgi:hypothetical protein
VLLQHSPALAGGQLLTLAMFPVLVAMYVRLANAEEREAIAEFPVASSEYSAKVPRFMRALSRPSSHDGCAGSTLTEDTMNTRTPARLDVLAFGWGHSAALVVLFVLCLVVALVLPGWPASPLFGRTADLVPRLDRRYRVQSRLGWITAIVFRRRLQSAERAFVSSIGGSPTFDIRQ